MKGRLLWGAVVASALAASSALGGGISGGGRLSVSNSELILLGPVEALSKRDGVVTVLGQKLPQRAVGNVQVGDTLAVFGSVAADGSLKVDRVQSQGLYVPGATTVLLTGVIQKTSTALGLVVVGGVSVDVTSLIALDQSAGFSVGSFVQFVGTQPASGGLMLAGGISGGGFTETGISGGGLTDKGISGGGFTNTGISGGGLTDKGISGGGFTNTGISGGGLTDKGISGGGFTNTGISGGGLTDKGISGGGLTTNATGISGGG